MGLGILDDRHLEHVPGNRLAFHPLLPELTVHGAGTAYMGAGSAVLPGGFQLQTAASREELDPRLKYDLTGKKPVVLIPQPSDDPNDPLVCFGRVPDSRS